MATSTPTVPRVFLDSSVFFAAALPYQLSQPPESLISDTARVVVAKDAPVIAAARAARAMLVATYDRKHLLAQSALIEATFGIIVATPESVLAIIE